MVFKCKICGGDLQVIENTTISTCESCGSTMTIPHLETEKRRQLYDRANHFYRSNDYDKAMVVYNRILDEDKNDAEAYWSLVLCKYGIEYVEDRRLNKRVPTCNRTRYTSIYADEDYKAALTFASVEAKRLYKEDAAVIDKIQKGILEVSSHEEPFDIFICYKESDESGRRTPDSVLAQELYYHLSNEGFRVFFARITLETKLGSAYEPYIFAALNSARVMVCLGTKPEYFREVWVKNEWSRYLTLMETGEKKALIPAYRDMDPYDLPEQFSHLQALDMGRLGFMQDLIHGIKKIIGERTIKEMTLTKDVISTVPVTIQSQLKRAFFNLEYGDWEKADELFEQILNQDYECAEAYIGKLLVELKLHRQEDLANLEQTLTESTLYKKALLFADEEYAKKLKAFEAVIQPHDVVPVVEEVVDKQELLYQEIQQLMKEELTFGYCRTILKKLNQLGDFEDSELLKRDYNLKLEQLQRKEKRVATVWFLVIALLGLLLMTEVPDIGVLILISVGLISIGYYKGVFQ